MQIPIAILTDVFWNKLFKSSAFCANILGITKINKDISSSRLFCSGVPVNKILFAALKKTYILF